MAIAVDSVTQAVLAAGLAWLYETEQPPGAIPDHHGYSCSAGDRRYRFCPAGARSLPVVVVDVRHPRYDTGKLDRVLLNPLGGAPEMDALVAAIEALGVVVADRWNGEAHHETGSLGLAERAHPTLLAGLRRYRAGCPDHRTVFCGGWRASKGQEDCTWLRDGSALMVLPDWPKEG